MCTMSSLAAAILWWHLKPSFLSCMTSSRNSMMVSPSAVWARTSLAMRSSSTAESTVRKSCVKGARGVQGLGRRAPLRGGAGVGRVGASTGGVAAWDAAVPGDEPGGVPDPYFTSCLAASILWHSSAPSILSSMTSRKKSMMRAAVVGLLADDVGESGRLPLRCCCSAWGPLVSYMCAIMWEDWVVVKGEISPQRAQRGFSPQRAQRGESMNPTVRSFN